MTPADPFARMSDRHVLEFAAAHFQRAAGLPPGSERRAAALAEFWHAYDEYGRRENVRVLRQLAAAGRRGALA